MASNKKPQPKDDWQDIPVKDDWEDVPVNASQQRAQRSIKDFPIGEALSAIGKGFTAGADYALPGAQIVAGLTPMGRLAQSAIQGGLGAVQGFNMPPEGAPISDRIIQAGKYGALDAGMGLIAPPGGSLLARMAGGAGIGGGYEAARELMSGQELSPSRIGFAATVGGSIPPATSLFQRSGGAMGKLADRLGKAVGFAKSREYKVNQDVADQLMKMGEQVQLREIDPALARKAELNKMAYGRVPAKQLESFSAAELEKFGKTGKPAYVQEQVPQFKISEVVPEKRFPQAPVTVNPPDYQVKTPAQNIIVPGEKQKVFIGSDLGPVPANPTQQFPAGAEVPIMKEDLLSLMNKKAKETRPGNMVPDADKAIGGGPSGVTFTPSGYKVTANPSLPTIDVNSGPTRQVMAGMNIPEQVQTFPQASYPIPQPDIVFPKVSQVQDLPPFNKVGWQGDYWVPMQTVGEMATMAQGRGKFKPQFLPSPQAEEAATAFSKSARRDAAVLRDIEKQIPGVAEALDQSSKGIRLKQLLEKMAVKENPADYITRPSKLATIQKADDVLGQQLGGLEELSRALRLSKNLRSPDEFGLESLKRAAIRASAPGLVPGMQVTGGLSQALGSYSPRTLKYLLAPYQQEENQ